MLISMMDGFEIEEIVDDEEPLFVSREDPMIMPDYSGKKPLVLSWIFSAHSLGLGDNALCGICKVHGKQVYFGDIVDAVRHVHHEHEVLGGSQIVMLGMGYHQTDYLDSTFSFSQTPTECSNPATSV